MREASLKIEKTCDSCDTEYAFNVDPIGFEDWRSGRGHIQNLLPNLAPGFRELLISGICDPCFDAMCAEADDEQYEYEEEYYAFDDMHPGEFL